MSDSPEELQQQLLEAQEALAEAQARCKRHDTEHLAVTKELEDNRSALLFMLEDLESSRKQIEHSFREWMSALDVVDDPIFLHDREFRILRCNKAYQQLAGIPFKQIIGQPYYEIFPKAATPLPCCLRAMGKAAEEEEEEVTVGEAVYRSRAFFIRDEQRDYLYSVHILEDISESRRAAAALYESEERLRKISESAQDAIIMMGADRNISFWNAAAERIFGYPAEEALGQDLHALIVPASEQAQFTKAFPHFEASGEGSIIGKVIEVTGLRKGGEAFPAELSVSATQLHGQWHAIGIVRDITGRKQAEEKVSKEKEKFRMLFDAIADTVAIHDLKGRILQVNHSACEHLGYSQEELLQMTVADIDTPEFAASVAENIKVLQEQGRLVAETAHIHRDGTVIPVELSARMIDYEGQPAVLSVARDITERKRAETTLRERNTLIEALLENAPIGFAMNSMDDGRMTYVSRRFAEIYGVPPGSLERLADFFEKVYRDPVFREQIRARVMVDISSGDAARMHWEDVPLITASGETRFISASNIPLPEQNVMISTVWDVTDRYKAAADLHEKEQNYRTLADSAPALIWTSGTDKLCGYFNQPWLNFTGRTLEQELGNGWVEGVHPGDLASCVETYTESFDRREPFSMDYRLRRHDGEYRWMRDDGCPRHDSDGNFTGYIGYLMDITERKQAEIAVQHAQRALATLSAVNRTLVRATDEGELLQAVCDAIVEQRGYRLTWVGYVQHDESKSIKIMARAGHDEGYLDAMQLTWAETERGMGPSGRAVRSGTTQLCQDIANDPQYLPWRDEALKRGMASKVALPLVSRDDTVFGILHVYAGEVNAFIPAEIDLLEEMAGDLAFGVHTLHVRHERDLTLIKNQEQVVQLHDSLEGTVRAIAGIVEMRDPYTAGHQIRVADLAAAIAGQMGLPEEQVHAIHLAGTVHDLGKIQIPAEILSKPGKINDLEYSLIKIHPQAGYDILKGINFPWPIADMVLQHHERMDGSGYPQGLKGDAILLEARILCVADVVEAISAHRPYRAGLGIETALDEISKNRGKFYDPQVADACLTLFRKEGYTFK